MSSEALAKTEKRLGKRPQAGLCHWHATKIGLTGIARRCGARCSGKRRPEIRGMPCRGYAIKGKKRCYVHGGRNGGARKPKYTAAEKQHMKRAQVEESDRLFDLWLKKQQQPKVPVWPREIKTDARDRFDRPSLEDEFRSHHRKRDRGWSPY